MLPELWRTRLGVNSPTNVIVGRLDERAQLCVQGSDGGAGQGGTVEAFTAEGRALMPCNGVLLTDRAVQAIAAQGIMPLVWPRASNELRLAARQSVHGT